MPTKIEVEGLSIDPGEYSSAVEAALRKAEADRLVERIWSRDHTVWKPDPTEIADRLGWLDIATSMNAEVPTLLAFAAEIKNAGISKVLLLGMGGSSLAPELFGKLLPTNSGLKLSVLDSTDPEAVSAQERSHDPATTLYIVSSKSGGTVETSSFFKYFYTLAKEKLGEQEAGKRFIAITDPGSGLAKIGEQLAFRRVFLADPNIGGRYSALSHFGLVPAALIGVDLPKLLAGAEHRAQHCASKEVRQNPGAVLGLTLGALALNGCDKVIFRLPEELASFADWAEQLIAESTGKEGKGILPVAGEPARASSAYGPDRVFVTTPESSAPDLGPNIQVAWTDPYDVGGQFFLWEYAIAVAGYMLGINPFDQPNVESAKIQTRQVVEEYRRSGKLPKGSAQAASGVTLNQFLKGSGPGAYIALQVYAAATPDLSEALGLLRTRLVRKYRLATTLGFGPRFLHSTGQLHKGDAGKGLFVQVVSRPPKDDLAIPVDAGAPTSEIAFGILKMAQALGDAQALRAAGRRVITFETDVDQLLAMIQQLTKEL
ncbi:MAG: hypothetical protein WD751_03050 [Anaerolineales bacterium]